MEANFYTNTMKQSYCKKSFFSILFVDCNEFLYINLAKQVISSDLSRALYVTSTVM